MKKHLICVSVLVGVLFVASMFISHKFYSAYLSILDINEQYSELLESQRKSHGEAIEQWKQGYEDLQKEYASLLIENDKLMRTELPVYEFTEAEVYLIAQCVEAEAGNYDNHKLSQQYVAQVILNRLHSSKFPDSVKDIIYQKVKGVPQFSVAYDGAMIGRKVEPETLANVYKVIVHGTDLPKYVCYFYAEGVKENWVNTLPVYVTVQGTVFAYEDKEDY